jgi:hypothetical protein
MRNKIKYYFACLIAGTALFAFSACSDITDQNVNPNQPTAVPAENLVSQAQYVLSNRLWSRVFNAEWPMLIVQHWAQNEYAEESRFLVDGNSFNGSWVSLYANVLNELKAATEIINANEGLAADLKANQLAVIEVLNVLTYHSLTDAFGDIPYSTALDPVDNLNPVYDSQSAIYADLVSRLKAAVSSMKPGVGSFGSADLIYGGDLASWSKFANSLLLRIAMRMSDVDGAAASAAISGMTPEMFIASNDENAMFNFDPAPAVANPLYIDAIINTRDDFCVTDILVDNLTTMGDPRLDAFAEVNASGDFIGMPSGLLDDDAFALKPTCSRPHTSLRTADAPAVLMDHAEVSFLLAEAYERGYLTGDAATAYAAGVTSSMNYWGFTDVAAIDGYITANAYDAANWKQSLGWQKWIAFYMNGTQAWAEWRRLDHPVLTIPVAAVNDVIPVRLPYPIDEQTSNSNFTVTNPNDLSTKMWWDIN